MKLKTPELVWLNPKAPYSQEYTDRYYSEGSPEDECRHVYLAANGLPDRWIKSTEKRFLIAEIGFGFGLNFILSASLHTKLKIQKHLHYIAFEKSPPSAKQVKTFFSNFHELKTFSDTFLKKIPTPIRGCHRIHFSKNITLDLHYGDVLNEISDFYTNRLKISAWFIDGFSPKTNPSIWNNFVCTKISQLSNQETTLSSYSASGSFRRNLVSNGFDVKKATGYGRKRHMTVAKFTANENHFEASKNKNEAIESVAIIGAGIAGCAAALALTKRNIPVQLFESEDHETLTQNRISLFALRPRLYRDISPESQFYLHSYLYTVSQLNLYSQNEDVGWNKTGLIQLEGALNKREKFSQEKYSSIYPSGIFNYLTNKQARELSKLDLSAGGLYFPDGGFVETAKLYNFCLDAKEIAKNYSTSVKSINYSDGKWTLYSAEQIEIAQSKTVIIANSHCLTQFNQTDFLPVSTSHGYSNWLEAKSKSYEPTHVICGNKTIFPSTMCGENGNLVAATYEKSLTKSSKLKAAKENVTGANQAFTGQYFLLDKNKDSEVGTRCGTPDRVPYIGRVPKYAYTKRELAHLRRDAKAEFNIADECFLPNLYISAGHGSNGLSTSSFGAEILASLINGDPVPVSKRHLSAICPSRIIIRDLKKQRI